MQSVFFFLGGGGVLYISCSLKHDTVPRVINFYCFHVKNPPKPMDYGVVQVVNTDIVP